MTIKCSPATVNQKGLYSPWGKVNSTKSTWIILSESLVAEQSFRPATVAQGVNLN